MPQYLAPGVYVEEIAGPRTIQGVGTSTAAFVGPCRFGPTSGRAELLTSYLDFVRTYGDANDLQVGGAAVPNYLALAAKGFFDEGGTSLYVARVFAFTHESTPADDHASAALGHAATPSDAPVTIRARFPGVGGRMMVTLTLHAGRNVLVGAGQANASLTRVREFDTVYAVAGAAKGVYVVRRNAVTGVWELHGHGSPPALQHADAVYPVSIIVDVRAPGVDRQGLPVFGAPMTIGDFGFDARVAGGGITALLTANPASRAQALTLPIALEGVEGLYAPSTTEDEIAALVARALLGDTILATAEHPTTTPLAQRQVSVVLQGGSDGQVPTADDYSGTQDTFADYQDDPLALPQRGLAGLASIDDISIVAAPGASSGWVAGSTGTDLAQEVNGAVITHCEALRYRVAALDTPPAMLPDQALAFRNLVSSDHAALYYPWITIPSPTDGSRLNVPPSGYLAGIWARSDANYGVIKAPANEVVRSALDLESRINTAQQELLNPEGVNCLRFFPGSGFLVWGARTISDDPEWKYLNMRRYFNYLEKSIDEGTQWVVFQPNGPALWDAVRHSVEGFLLTEWKSGALLGAKPEQGYFVKCDASTMTQDDLDNGRLICIIGVAAAKPAEFVIFRISQWTATPTA